MQKPINRVLVYIDGSEESIMAAQFAIVMCKTMKLELYALYVVNTKALEELVKSRIFLAQEQEEYSRDIEKDADRYLNHVKHLALQKGFTIETIKRRGTPFLEIKNEISQRQIDLLVIGEISKIRSRRDELFNETERAMRNVNCSVLIVKDEERVFNMYESLV